MLLHFKSSVPGLAEAFVLMGRTDLATLPSIN